MNEAFWIALPFVASLGSGILAYIVAQARYETSLARDRETLVEARTQLIYQQKALEARTRAAESEARRRALDEFLADVRVEERHYVREIESSSVRRRCLVLQERICFRNIPLSQWVEREMGLDVEHPLLEPVPATQSLAAVPQKRRLLR